MPEIKRTRLRTRQDLMGDTRESAATLLRTVSRFPDDVWLQPTDPAGWTIRDHVAHVIWWDIATIAQMRDGITQQAALGISDIDWSTGIDAINAIIRAKSIDATPDDVRTRWQQTQDELQELLASWPERTYQAPAREKGFVDEGDVRLIDVLTDYLGGHYREHLAYITAIADQRLIDLDSVSLDSGSPDAMP